MTKDERTKRFLLCVASHSSNNRIYKKAEYIVEISESRICMYPTILVYPSIHKKHLSDKQTVLYHVLENHFRECFTEHKDQQNGCIDVVRDTLSEGTYKYIRSVNKKTRRWVKIHN